MTDKLAEAIAHASKARQLGTTVNELLVAARSYHALPVVDAQTLGNELHKKYEDYLSHHDYFQMPDSQIRFASRYLRATYPDGLRWAK